VLQKSVDTKIATLGLSNAIAERSGSRFRSISGRLDALAL